MKKINIVKESVDIENLNMNIDYYRIKKSMINSIDSEDIRLFMNRYTIAALMEQENLVNLHSITGRVLKYRGFKVFQDDELAFGKVEII